MFGLGPVEMVIILVILVMLFGVGKLPEIGGAIGKTIREFRSTITDDKKHVDSEKVDETPKDAAA
ncbi:MAG: twin-arginine translocase TatA/TatE family subunit [Caldilineaceae bacterium]|nr:twin-arginine translocase TatA/TatE family subunit [Caldilineaceae bacterium]MBP8107841.1 twin-arginine translocase TatA/TatE family subunit [Caldilineaceae bacterium]MBP8122971.1 twin-arginine translocase TatA/TatE family subunit [Caldilineaceae bacterium]MBP9073164.1 twin-arginine translocase TatA/TatE family subunit [Caldilineaceae bacterium]